MARSFSADIRDFADKTEKKMLRIFVDSVSDVMEAAQTSATGITAGGTLIEGRIPVVSADLINSLKSEVIGGAASEGPASYAVALANVTIGQAISFSWGIEYAARVEYGFTGTDAAGRTFQQPGWHFVGVNAARWSDFVAKNMALQS